MPLEYTSSADLRFSMVSVKNGTADDLYMRIQAPKKYGWASVGIGHSMSSARMFVIYPSAGDAGTTLSIRESTGYNQPKAIDNHNCQSQQGTVADDWLDTAFVCYGEGNASSLQDNPRSSSWMWAVGPDQTISSNSVSANIEIHKQQGLFTLDMLQAQQIETSGNVVAPMVTGTSNIGSQASTMQDWPSQTLVEAHAILLGLAFLVVFPFGIIVLRFGSCRLHWISQMFAFLLAFVGWVIAILMCTDTVEFSSFTNYHQIIGLLSVSLLFPQVALGFLHHWRYKVTGQSSWMRIPHLNLGRIAMILGLINGILGFVLMEDNTGAIIYGVFAAVIFSIVVGVVAFDYGRKQSLPPKVPPKEMMAGELSE